MMQQRVSDLGKKLSDVGRAAENSSDDVRRTTALTFVSGLSWTTS
jgi:hypothetical protein